MRECSLCLLLFLLLTGNAKSESPPRTGPLPRPEPWYERVLRRVNPTDFDYGVWLERRRRALLEASIENPYFWYSFTTSLALILMILIYAKHCSDFRKFTWMAAGWLADLHNQDQYSRQIAREAIDRYNRHIEACNRAIEAAEDGSWKERSANAELENIQEENQELRRQLTGLSSAHKRVCDELKAKQEQVADLSTRLDLLEQLMNKDGTQRPGESHNANEMNKLLVTRVNILQRQLKEEQERNRKPVKSS